MAEKINLFELDVNYDDVLKENAKLLEKLTALKNEQKELNKKITDTKNATDAERQAFVSNQAVLKNVTSQYNQNNKVLQSLNDTQLNNITTVEQARKALTATGTLWARQTKLEGENSESSKRLAKRKLELTERLKKLESATGDNTRQVGNYSGGIKDAAKGMGGFQGVIGKVIPGINKMDLSLLKLLANPIVLIVAGVVLIFTKLVQIFRSTDEGATEMDARMAQLSAGMDVLKRRALVLIKAFKHLFSGEFRKAGEAFKETVSGIKDEFEKAKNAAYDYVYALDALNDREIAAISEQATLRREIEKNITLSKNQAKSNKERIAALEEAGELEKQLAEQKVKFAEEAFDLEVGDAARKANIDKDVLKNFIALGEAEQTAARENNKELAAAWNFLGDERIKKLEEAYAKGVKAETFYFKKSKETTSQLSGLRNKLSKENESNIKAGNEATIKNLEIELAAYELQNESKLESDQELTADLIEEEANRLNIIATKEHEINQQKYESGLIDKQEYELQKLQLDTDYSNAYLELIDETILQADEKNQEAIQKAKEQADIDKQNEIDRQVVDFENERIIAEENAITKQEWEREQLDLKYQTEIENAKKTGVDTSLIEEKYRLAKQKADIISFQTKAKLTGDFANNLANIFGKQSKAGKLAAAAAATISAIQGATGAFASLSSIPIVGPALGAAAAVAALAAGFANVKKIYAVKSGLPGDGDGGSVPSGGGGFSVSTSNISDGGLVPRAAIEGGSGQIEEGMTAALENAPQRNVLVVDEVTAKQNEQNEIDVSGEV
jgi:hypothetical protein